MLGGAIKRPAENTPVIVRHTEEVVVGADNKVPLPKDHLTGQTLTPKASKEHPIRLINLTTGVRTQITSGNMSANGDTIKFKNPAAGVAEETEAKTGDHIRIFWEEVITSDESNEAAVEVTISPSTFPGTSLHDRALSGNQNIAQISRELLGGLKAY